MTTSTDPDITVRLAEAVAEYRGRQAGTRHPGGNWICGAWQPDEIERQTCCRYYPPTNQPRSITAYPESARRHCNGLDHVARLFGVPNTVLRKAVRAR